MIFRAFLTFYFSGAMLMLLSTFYLWVHAKREGMGSDQDPTLLELVAVVLLWPLALLLMFL